MIAHPLLLALIQCVHFPILLLDSHFQLGMTLTFSKEFDKACEVGAILFTLLPVVSYSSQNAAIVFGTYYPVYSHMNLQREF